MSETKQTLGREEEAEAMLGRTQVSPWVAWYLSLFFLLTILAVPFLQNVQPARLKKLMQPGALDKSGKAPLPPLLPSPHKVRAARTARDGWELVPDSSKLKSYEIGLEKRSVVFDELRPRVQSVLTGALGAGNEQVDVGRDGWLFYRIAVNSLTAPGFLKESSLARRVAAGAEQPNPVRAIVRLQQQLALRGITLIVMPVPVKATIYPEKLWPRYNDVQGPPQNPSFELFKRLLEAEGVVLYDPTETMLKGKRLLRQAQFFPTDSHWTPAAVELIAADLANLIRTFLPLPPRQPIVYTRQEASGTDPGDLLRLLGLPKDQKLYSPERVPLRPVLAPGGKLCQPDPTADILVLGDSYSGAYQGAGAGLVEQIAFNLQRPVDHLAVPNGGSWAARDKLRQQLLRGEDRLAGKKLLIYEFTARDLVAGDWKILDLPRPFPDSQTVHRQAAASRRASQGA